MSRQLMIGSLALLCASGASLASQTQRVGSFTVDVSPTPVVVDIHDTLGRRGQRLALVDDDRIEFALDDTPVVGMAEGGQRPERGTNWREPARLTRDFDVVLIPGGAPRGSHFTGQRTQVRL